MNRHFALIIPLAMAAGCATQPSEPQPEPQSPPPAIVSKPQPAPAEPKAATVPVTVPAPPVAESSPRERPAEARPAPAPTPAPALTTAQARQEALRLARRAADALDLGEELAARADIEQALSLDQESKTAACLLRGITGDPASLGRDSTSYTVRPGESLARIAQRALGDACEFYLLARYNQIRVPRKLVAGQTLRIPGAKPLAGPEPAVPVNVTPTPVVATPAPPPPPVPAPGPDMAKIRAQVDSHHRAALAAFRKQDLRAAIREWDQVLSIDPTNDLARARRQEALELERRLRELK